MRLTTAIHLMGVFFNPEKRLMDKTGVPPAVGHHTLKRHTNPIFAERNVKKLLEGYS